MPRVHPDGMKGDEKEKRARLRSKSSDSKDESSESEESIYNSWKNKLRRLKRNKRMNKNEKLKNQEKLTTTSNSTKSAQSIAKGKYRKKSVSEPIVDWESKTPFVFTRLGSNFPPIAEAEETVLIDDDILGKYKSICNLYTCTVKLRRLEHPQDQ